MDVVFKNSEILKYEGGMQAEFKMLQMEYFRFYGYYFLWKRSHRVTIEL